MVQCLASWFFGITFIWGGGQDFWYEEKNRGRFVVEHLELNLRFIDMGVHIFVLLGVYYLSGVSKLFFPINARFGLFNQRELFFLGISLSDTIRIIT